MKLYLTLMLLVCIATINAWQVFESNTEDKAKDTAKQAQGKAEDVKDESISTYESFKQRIQKGK